MSIAKWAGIAAMVAMAACASAPQANEGDWKLLGERTVNKTVDHDQIAVTAAEGNFHRIALRVKGAPVDFEQVTVHFRNGEDQVVNMREEIAAGGETRAIDLEGKDRVIQTVTFNYQTDKETGPRAVVELWGKS